MDFSALATGYVLTGLALYVLVCILCWWLLSCRRYVILLLWPVIIYFLGPTLTDFLQGVPGLDRYVFEEQTLAETLVILCYFVGVVVADSMLNLSAIIEDSIHNPTVRSLAASPLFLPLFFGTAVLAIVLQINILRTYGTVLTGNYAYWSSIDDDEAGWGFLAGLYEIIFLCFMVAMLGGGLSRRTHHLINGIYVLTALLRLAGGTRLVLVKELALIIILLYLQGRIPGRKLLIVSGATLVGGGVIGLMRSSGAGLDGGMLGPLYSVVIESALNALSFNIAYQMQLLGGLDPLAHLGDTLSFLVLSIVPGFLRGGITATELEAMGPYGAGYGGFNTISPVGGMSGFATLTYFSGNVMVAVSVLVIGLAVVLRFTPASRWKRLGVLVLVLNAIHFWRDPIDIALKLLVQDMLIVLLFLYVPCLAQWRIPQLGGGGRAVHPEASATSAAYAEGLGPAQGIS